MTFRPYSDTAGTGSRGVGVYGTLSPPNVSYNRLANRKQSALQGVENPKTSVAAKVVAIEFDIKIRAKTH